MSAVAFGLSVALVVAVLAAFVLWRANARLAAALGAAFADARRRDAERERAVAAERERIFDNLHDDLGARLLQLVHESREPRHADLARAALQDLRDVVTRSRGATGTLEQVLGEIRAETESRLAAVGASLRWEQPEALPELALERDRALHLYRIAREAITNALRHAPGRRLRVRIRVSNGQLDFELTDDGVAGGASSVAGRGIASMQQRAERLEGEIAWARGTDGGTKVLLTMPLSAGTP